MTHCSRFTLAIIALLGVVGFAAADDLASVEQRLVETWRKHKSISAKMTVATHLARGATTVDAKGDGTLELLRKDGKTFVRIELKHKITQTTGRKSTDIVRSQLTILDDKFMYMLTKAGGHQTAVRSKAEEKMTGDPKAILDDYRKTHTLKLLPDETTDVGLAYVVQATLSNQNFGAGAKSLLYFHKDTGVMVKNVRLDPQGKPVTTITYSDLKTDVDINPGRFIFKAPPGVRVVDKTKEQP